MRRGDILRVLVAGLAATLFIKAGLVRLPPRAAPEPLMHPPVLVYSDPMLAPLVVQAPRRARSKRKPFERASAGKVIRVLLTQYCLQGTTRRDNYVREGIVAADPRVFPLAHYVEVFLGKRYLGKFLVDDTGQAIKGAKLDIWTPSCSEARRFGLRRGMAMLVRK